ncbi:MAG: transporter [Halobacteriales archaeon]
MDQETKLEIGVGLVGGGVFIFALLAVGTQFGNGAISEEGGFVLVGVICGFVLLMTALGYWLSGQRE